MATKHILVIGATGQSGIDFSTAALAAGHKLTLYVRTPSKVPTDISSSPNVIIVKGNLDDAVCLETAVSSGATVFVSFAGPVANSVGTPVTDCMRILFPLLIKHSYTRALVLGTCSYKAPQDLGALKWRASIMLIKIIGGDAFKEFSGLGAFLSTQDVGKIKWTLFRVPFLGNGEAKPVTATYTGTGQDGFFLNRKSAAEWVLKELNADSEWVGKAPVLSN